jgi:hypothetical protein
MSAAEGNEESRFTAKTRRREEKCRKGAARRKKFPLARSALSIHFFFFFLFSSRLRALAVKISYFVARNEKGRPIWPPLNAMRKFLPVGAQA